ncbi:hypothetical protein CFBP6624_14860 [Agrobacterium tumefaciens]|uniref:Uncharacterized protein n=1 Tax=Agrobacterium tumefaciens TaxID=358 RepID=A0AAE6BNW6_AGRTU|nr:hypothetical protein CFBP6624_14860 [Agrobacterium tumefaciens]
MPRFSGLCLSERVLQPIRFGEIERPTTNQTLSLPRSRPEDFAYQTPKYESDVFLSQPAPVQPQNQNVFRFIAEQGQYRLGKWGGDERGK